jgi:polyisoprenoid-binding protein YceI
MKTYGAIGTCMSRLRSVTPLRVATLTALVSMPWVVEAQGGTRPAGNAPAIFHLVPSASHVSYAVDEVFLEENNRLFTAVGTAPGVSGEIVLDLTHPHLSAVRSVVVDLRQLTSDSERRDRALRERFLESRRHPYARLDTGGLSGLPRPIPHNRPFAFQLVGDLAVHGVARRTQWRGEATLSGDTLRGHATTRVVMTDFGIEVPRFLWLRVADGLKLDIRFVAVRAQPRPDVPNVQDPTPTPSRGGLQ